MRRPALSALSALSALALAAACADGRGLADPTTGCSTETVCARTCEVPASAWASWCAVRCGACGPTDADRIPLTTDTGEACALVEVPVAEARPATCWIPVEPWKR